MDLRLRQAHRDYAVGNITIEQLIRQIRRIGGSLELLEISDSVSAMYNPVSVIIDLGYMDDAHVFGPWDFNDDLAEFIERRKSQGGPYAVQGPELLQRFPEMVDVFGEVDIDLTQVDDLYLDFSPGTPPFISFEVVSRNEALRAYAALEEDLGLEGAVDLRQYRGNIVIWDQNDAAFSEEEPQEFDGRIQLLTHLVEAIEEDPGIPVTLNGHNIRDLIDLLRRRSEDVEMVMEEGFYIGQDVPEDFEPDAVAVVGIVVYRNTNGVITDSYSDNTNAMSELDKSTIEEAIELVLHIDGYGNTLNLVPLSGGDLIQRTDIDDPVFAGRSYQYIVEDMLTSANRWGREIVWLPKWTEMQEWHPLN